MCPKVIRDIWFPYSPFCAYDRNGQVARYSCQGCMRTVCAMTGRARFTAENYSCCRFELQEALLRASSSRCDVSRTTVDSPALREDVGWLSGT